MKVTREWLEATDHCPDGLAFALGALPPDGLELEKCWALLARPDWVVSLAVQSNFLSLPEARWIVERTLTIFSQDVGDHETQGVLIRMNAGMLAVFGRLREEVSALAFEAVAIKNNLDSAHRLNCAGQLITSDLASLREGDNPVALKRLQGAAFSLGLSMGQTRAAELIKMRMMNLVNTRRGRDVERV